MKRPARPRKIVRAVACRPPPGYTPPRPHRLFGPASDAVMGGLEWAVGEETGGDEPDGTPEVGEPELATDAEALDLILGAPPRQTNVKRLRDSEVVRQFREDLLNGAVRIDRLNQVLSIVVLVVKQVLKLR